MDKPDAYQKGWVEFYKFKFKVTSDVLIPRPETELLVDNVLDFIHQFPTSNSQLPTILDIGTGTGNIAISIAKNLSTSKIKVKIIATDISKKALDVAKQNATLHQVLDHITFIQSDLLSFLTTSYQLPTTNQLILVTNLPYIPTERIPYLDSSVKDFEPHVALDGGEDGFELYRELFKQIIEKELKPNLIVGEIDYTHGELAVFEAQKYFPDCRVEVKTDLAHKQRILLINYA